VQASHRRRGAALALAPLRDQRLVPHGRVARHALEELVEGVGAEAVGIDTAGYKILGQLDLF